MRGAWNIVILAIIFLLGVEKGKGTYMISWSPKRDLEGKEEMKMKSSTPFINPSEENFFLVTLMTAPSGKKFLADFLNPLLPSCQTSSNAALYWKED